ncbi:MAG TPA: acetate kinase, partial [Bryobacteraceae bacterium]|nr:acetate kinase [Bryobacteraceae bacterium]
MRILVVNGGSSSFKCACYELGPALPEEAPAPAWQTRVEWSREAKMARLKGANGERSFHAETLADALPAALEGAPPSIDVAGHRIVHGGKAYRETTPLNAEVRAAIGRQAEFAPVHNRFELEAVEAVERLLGPEVEQLGVFDTAFHATLDPAAYVYPGPYGWLDEGVRRYGFHGISYQYATRQAARMLRGQPESLRLVCCHLGNGASLAAVRGGRSVDTTMGFTPLEG